MRQVCESCGEPFVAQRLSARFCSSKCRSRAYAAGVRRERLAAVPPSTAAADAVRAELRRLGVLATSLAAVKALVLARHLDASTGAASVSFSRLLAEVMDEVRRDAARRPAAADELAAMRRRRPPGLISDE